MVSNFPQTIQLGSAGAIDGDHNDEDKDSKTLTVILKKKNLLCARYHTRLLICIVSLVVLVARPTLLQPHGL